MVSRASRSAALGRSPFRKHSVYLPVHLLAEVGTEANRLDRSLSWMIQHAWRLAREEIMASERRVRGG